MQSEIVPGFDFDEAKDLRQAPYWFLDATHSVPPWTPLFGWFWTQFCRHGMQYGAEALSLPTSRGWDWRFKDGGGYLTVYGVDDEAEIKERTERFRSSIRPFIEDYDGLWEGFKQEMLDRYRPLMRRDPDGASNIELLQQLEEIVAVTRRMWEIHFYMMYGVYSLYSLFEEICQELLGIDDTSAEFHALVRGYDNKVFQVDRSLWQFARDAQSAGIASALEAEGLEEITRRLEATAQGSRWLARFRAFLDEDGWRIQRMAEINLPSWVEDPTPALQIVRRFLASGEAFHLDQRRERLAEERDAAARMAISRIPESERAWFSLVLTVAQRSGTFSEEHNHYLEAYTHSLIRRTAMAIGRRLAAAGTVADPDDVLFLNPEDIRRVLLVPEAHDLRDLVLDRRARWESWQAQSNAPLLGRLSLQEAVGRLVATKDPIALKVVVGAMPQVATDVQADLYGICGSPGTAEGIARVILDESRLDEIQPGDILVAATTSPSWTSVFSFLSGVIVDRGASLSHAAVVGREYGIPVVMNVFEGTTKLRSGQRIRIDGTRGHVFVLD